MPKTQIQPEEDPWLTVAEIADELRLTPATVRSWISQGTLRAKRAGQRKWLVQRSELDRMLAGEDLSDPENPGLPDGRPMDVVLAPHQSPHWAPEALEYVKRPSWLRYMDASWRAYLDQSEYAPPDPWFVQRVRDLANAAARKAAALANLEGEDPGEWWHRQAGLVNGALSHEMAADANRPGHAALWADFDEAVTRLDTAMREHSLADEQAALDQVSVAMHDIAEVLEETGYPWPETSGRPVFVEHPKQEPDASASAE